MFKRRNIRRNYLYHWAIGCLFLVWGPSSVYAQSEAFFGFNFRPLVPSNLFTNNADSVTQNGVHFNITTRGAYSLGAALRLNLHKQLTLESGIQYTRRSFGLLIDGPDTGIVSRFRIVSYEIPLKAQLHIRISEKWYMGMNAGPVLDFYANDLKTESYFYKQLGRRRSWLLLAGQAGFGWERRDEKFGTWYLGAGYQRYLKSIMASEIEYDYNGVKEKVRTDIFGNYFFLELKYYLPNKRSDFKEYY